MNVNKKKLMTFGMLGLFSLMLVSAIAYYSFFTVTLTVDQPIEIGGEEDQVLSGECTAGESCLGNEITIENTGDSSREVVIIDNADTIKDIDEVNYIGKMYFTQKDLDTWVADGNSADIEYTMTGETFVVKGIPTEYTLIYFPNTEGNDFATNVDNVIVLSEGANDIESLPLDIDVGDDYCNVLNSLNETSNPSAEVCNGAKLWLIPGNEEEAMAKLASWSEAETYLFETDLIVYTKSSNGELNVPAESMLTVYPEFEINQHADDGEETVGITIA